MRDERRLQMRGEAMSGRVQATWGEREKETEL